jgi:hypothetical protein
VSLILQNLQSKLLKILAMTLKGEIFKEAKAPTPCQGSAGLMTQLPGQATTVDGIAATTGGIGPGNIIE